VHQDQLVDMLVRKLQETVLTPANLDRLRAALRRQIDDRRETSCKGADGLRKRLAGLNREIDRAAENLLRAPAEVLGLIGEKLSALKRQRDHLQEELKIGKSANRPATEHG
jgi:hypothetical protein